MRRRGGPMRSSISRGMEFECGRSGAVGVARLSAGIRRRIAAGAASAGAAARSRQGTSGAARRAARRGDHHAAQRSADLGARRQRRRNARGGAADRAAAGAGFRRAGDFGHRHLRGAGGTAIAGRHPAPVHSARRAAFRAAFPRPLAARSRAVCRIRFVAQSHSVMRGAQNSDDPGQRPAVGTLVQPLAPVPGDDCGPARAFRHVSGAVGRRRRTLRAARRAAGDDDRQSQARRAGAAGRPGRAQAAQGNYRHAPGRRRGVDPSRRRSLDRRRPWPASRQIPHAVDGDRSTPSGARRGHRRNRQGRGASPARCARSALSRCRMSRSTSPTHSASLA